MLSLKRFASLTLAALTLLNGCQAALQQRRPFLTERQDSESSANASSSTNSTSTATLEPVIPPEVNQDALSTLLLGRNVTLAWAGSPSSLGSRRMVKREDAVYSKAQFAFKYPTVPLDHSNFVTGVSCSANALTGVLIDKAYTFAKANWVNVANLVFITSVDGCGLTDANDFFYATSVTFSDDSKTFTAMGSSAKPQDVASYMTLEWGNPGTLKLKRSIDKQLMFEPHELHKRGDISLGMSWSVYAQDFLGTDTDAPWDDRHAAPLFEWSKEGGEEDDSYEKGEVASADGHHKRSNVTELGSVEERDLSYGLKLYCVDCGFEGSAEVYGRLDTGFFSIDRLGAGFRADYIYAGLNLGMEAFVKYEKEWEKELARVNLAGWEIPLLISIGPFVSISISASAGISATGALLLGAGVEWDDLDIYLDFLSPIDESYAHNLVPSFSHVAEATGELKIEAGLGLPLKFGLGIEILEGLFNAEAAVVDTPSIVAEGVFEVSADVTDDGEVEYDINGGCYGIAWDVHFENELNFELEADFFGLDAKKTFPLIDKQESDPIAEGCIGYVNDGTDDNGDDPQGTGDKTGMGGNGLNSAGNGLAGSGGNSNSGTGSTSNQVVQVAAVQVSSSISSTVSSSSTSSSSSSTSSSLALAKALAQPSTTTITTSSVATPAKSSTSSSSPSSSTTSTKSSSTTSQRATSKSSSTTPAGTTSSRSSSTTTSAGKSSSTTTQQTTNKSSSTTVAQTSSKLASTTSPSKSSSTTSAPTTSKSSSTTSAQTTSKSSSTTGAAQSTSKASSSTSSIKSSTTTSSKATTTTTAACTPSTSAVTKTPAPTGTTCKSVVQTASVPAANNLGAATTVSNTDACALSCLKSTTPTQCLSFSYNDANKSCQLYSKAIKNLGTTSKSGSPSLTFYDRDCYAYNTCAK